LEHTHKARSLCFTTVSGEGENPKLGYATSWGRLAPESQGSSTAWLSYTKHKVAAKVALKLNSSSSDFAPLHADRN